MNVAVVNIFLMISTFRGAFAYSIYESNERQILAKDGQFPYQALIRLRHGKHYPLCNSIILNSDYVLTTAGCVKYYRLSAENLQVVAGGLTADMTSSDNNHVQTSYVKEIQVHPMWYITDEESADIALLRVSPQFQETSFVKRAEIGNVNISSSVNISGWGSIDDLVYLEGKVYDENTCNRLLKTELPQSVFCIGSDRGEELISTKDFAGAGVGSGNRVYGIVSSTENSLATLIQPYKIWIESAIKSYKTTTEVNTETNAVQTENTEYSEETDETDESDYTDETERPTQYTTPRYRTTYSTIPFRPSTSYAPTTDDETEETDDSDYTDETEETDETERPTRYTTPKYPSTYSTIPFRPSTSYAPTTDDETEDTEDSDYTDETEETDETERPTRYTTPRYPSTYSTIPFRPSTSYKPTTDDETEDTEDSDYTDETEETDETEKPTRYTTPRYPSTYSTIPFRPSTSYKPTTDEDTDETEVSDYANETEKPTRYTTPRYLSTHQTIPFRPSTSYKPTTDDTTEETDEFDVDDNDADETNDTVETTSEFRTEFHTIPSNSQDTTKLLDASTSSTLAPNVSTDSEQFTANAEDSHQEPISSGSAKYNPRSFIFSISFCYFTFFVHFNFPD